MPNPKRQKKTQLALLATLVLACASEPLDPALAFRQEAEAALAEGEAEKAAAAYQLALSVSPDDLQSWRGLLRAQIASGDGEAAYATLDGLIPRDPEPVDPCPALALAVDVRLRKGGDPRTPAERAGKSRCPDAERRLAQVSVRESGLAQESGDTASAIALMQQAVELDPARPGYALAAAELLIGSGRTREAVAQLATALERHPNHRGLRGLMVHALSIR